MSKKKEKKAINKIAKKTAQAMYNDLHVPMAVTNSKINNLYSLLERVINKDAKSSTIHITNGKHMTFNIG